MIGRMARYVLVLPAIFVSGCTPELGDVPFSCERTGVCPTGYSCQATVCVRDGVSPAARRPRRVSWINPPEMYWFAAKDGGAALVYNDGFTPGAKGIYEIRVSSEGALSEPRALIAYGDQTTMSSAVVALPDGRYGVITVRFPNVEEDVTTLELLAIDREASSSAVEKLFTATTPFLGGVEPPYVGAVIDGTTLNIAWTVPSGGGRVQLLHLERQGSLWGTTWTASTQLPPDVLPLSGDCQVFRGDDGFLTVRVGFEGYALATVDPATVVDSMATMTPFVPTDDEPLFGWREGVFAMRRGDADPITGTYPARFTLLDPAGSVIDESSGYALPDSASPFVGTPFEGGVLVAPVSRDPALPTIDVAWRSKTEPLRIVASVPRQSDGLLYTARAFGVVDTAYVAWTEFYESGMDLWIGVSDLHRGGALALQRRPSRVRRWEVKGVQPRLDRAEGRGAP